MKQNSKSTTTIGLTVYLFLLGAGLIIASNVVTWIVDFLFGFRASTSYPVIEYSFWAGLIFLVASIAILVLIIILNALLKSQKGRR